MKLKRITSLILGIAISFAALADTLTLKEGHPDTYTVVKGDTLWDISAYFLNSPWLWPRLWQANSQIENPHLIYPGDVLTLIWIDGQPRLTRGTGMESTDAESRSYSHLQSSRKNIIKLSPFAHLEDKGGAIPTIPLSVISAFLSKDHIIDPNVLIGAPRLLGDAVGTPRFFEGDIFYAEGKYDRNKLYGIYRLGVDYNSPETGEFLGKQLSFIGHTKVSKDRNVRSTEQVTPMDLLGGSREARQGDLILPIPEYETLPAYFLPQPVSTQLTGNILGALNGVGAIGKWDVVAIDKGKREGMNIGSMFSILRSGPGVIVKEKTIQYEADASALDKFNGPNIVIPAERLGELMVFKVYEKVSIGLIMRSRDAMGSTYKIEGLEF